MTAARLLAAWQRGGLGLAGRVMLTGLQDRLAERRLGIDAAGLIPIERLITEWTGCHDYYPTSFRSFDRLMQGVPLRPGVDSFVDFGSGKGRVLLIAARYPFRRVIGVEIAGQLNRAARRNIARCRVPLQCDDISIWEGSAAEYSIPADASVFYFYNPFHEPVLGAVLRRIERSLHESPRPAWIVFNNTRHMQAIEAQLPWLVPVARIRLEHNCAVYRPFG